MRNLDPASDVVPEVVIPPSAAGPPEVAGDTAQPAWDETDGRDVSLLQAVFDSLDATGCSWVILRGDESSVNRGGDIDLLIQEDSVGTMHAALAPLGFAEVPSAGQGSHRFLLGYDQDTLSWIRLDFTTKIDFGIRQELKTSTAADLLARRRRVRGENRLYPDDAFWHFFLHRILGRRQLDSEVLAELAQAARPEGPLAQLVDEAEVAGASSVELLDFVRYRQWERLDALRPAFVRAWRTTRGADPVVARTTNALNRVVHAPGALIRPTGISVTIIGPDGAGKTTLAEGLRETLPLPARYVYMGVWREHRWDRTARFIPGLRLGMRLARLLTRSAEASFHRVRGRIVLLDRFTYDVLLPSANLDNRGRITAALVRRVCPEPDLVIVLNAPADVMFARKGEHGVDELELRRLSYLEVARTRDHSVIIDATKPIEAVRAEAQRAVWARLRERWAGR